MKYMLQTALVLAALLVGGLPSTALSAGSQFRLADADKISSNRYLILTVPLDESDRLRAVAADIETRFDVTLTAEWPLLSISVHCLVVDASRHPDVDALMSRMRSDERIRTVQRMQGFEILSNAYRDSLLPIQTALHQMNALRAHLKSTGAGIKVAVVDSGVDGDHPDLIGRLAETRDFVSTSDIWSAEAHGTAIAGLIAADASNAQGMVGVAPGADILGLRACWQDPDGPGRCSSFSLARALNFAILNRVDVINLSLGGPYDPLLEELVRAAIDDGAIIVAAWGETERPAFPASVRGVIAAGPPSVSAIPAPSVDVISTAPEASYRYVSGSSVAAAHVTGVVALLLAARSDLTSVDVGRLLMAAVDQRDGVPMLDACKALGTIRGSQAFCRR